MDKGKKKIDIFVNEYEHEVKNDKITYDEIVALYLGSGEQASAEYIIKYSKGPAQNVSGTLSPGQEVKGKDGMRFRISGTGES